ncbi:MAG TPA: ATP-binding protein [Thermoanaerobaculia bacterium]|jgi:signal transduction histidine kinase|nr:ATP-binding protein [Thermoanaerobaculia bacterium]
MSKKLRVLLVEDLEDDAELILRDLRRGGYEPDYRRVETAEEMASALDEGGWEIVLSDYNLPRFSAPAALELLKSRGMDVPFIIISGTIGEQTAVDCMRAGASDFLLKGNLTRLVAALQRELRAARDRQTQREEEQRRREIENAREQAESENRFKSQFLANMSHELRTPLNAVIGFSELLEDEKAGPLAPMQRDYIEAVLASARHLLNLINDILDLSKIDAGRVTLSPEPTSIAALVASIKSVLQSLANKSGVALETDVAADLPELHVDPLRIKQVLYNLLANGLKFTPKGGRVSLRARREGDCVRVDVVDTGIGIRREDLPLLFREFQQIASPGRVKPEGTGLGLALAKRLVELHDGEISVKSEPARGTTFTVKLPLQSQA